MVTQIQIYIYIYMVAHFLVHFKVIVSKIWFMWVIYELSVNIVALQIIEN